MTDYKLPKFAALLELPQAPLVKPTTKRGANKNKSATVSRAKPKEALSDPNGVPAPTRDWRSGTYKHSTAMRISLDRARAAQPPVVTLASSPADGAKFNR